MKKLSGFFVTGTDTGIGKTWIGCALMTALKQRGHSVIGMKPIASGCDRTTQGLRNEDALHLQATASLPVPYEQINPYAFEPPIAPHIAAAETGAVIDLDHIRRTADILAQQADYLVIEGVGGWRVPLSKEGDVATLASMLDLPVILVVGIRLGCLNHALLTAEAIVHSGLSLAGWVANEIDPYVLRREANIQTLESRIPAPCLGNTPFISDFNLSRLANCIDLKFLL